MTQAPERRSGELTAREMLRWTWRQLTSMRTALVLLLLLALGAVPGSIIPQSGVDSLAVSRWKDAHPSLTPVYEKLDLFSVYDSVWFSAIYLLLVLSLVGCIVPRLFVYAKAMRALPPAAPRNLTRLPDSAGYRTDEDADAVLARAREVLAKRYRLRPAAEGDGFVAGERGRLREAGNLLFHLSVLIVLAGFGVGALYGFEGGVVIIQQSKQCPDCGTFSNTLSQYDDFDPGGLFTPDQLNPFSFTVQDFGVDWLKSGDRAGQARGFDAKIAYRQGTDGAEQHYDLKVNHPLSIGDTDVFLIGHGYAPVLTIRDGHGDVAWSGPTAFLPQDQSFLSFGVIKARTAKPGEIGLEGLFYPTFEVIDGNPVTVFPEDLKPALSMLVYTGDLGLDDGSAQSVYVLDKDNATQVMKADGRPFRLDIEPGQTVKLPDGLGSVTFDGVQPWVRVQISQSPGKDVALAGVVLALIGLCGSLFVRPRRVWVRARPVDDEDGVDTGGRTLVEVAVLDRSGNHEVDEVVRDIVEQLQGQGQDSSPEHSQEHA
ncbi:cytochrome c biogenesis protein ResB [Nocardioides panacisoli]|uniref:Cytochrome c biogenesis protein ResB n=1 Tax=Nocardioides panacisoli TaxID=627624 RepID=A0ABP7ICW8_9ACTN